MQKRISEEYSTTLCPEGIEEISERIKSFLTELKLPKRDVLRYSMTAEEILLDSEKTSGAAPVRLKTGKRFRRYYITLEIDGKPLNVFAAQDEECGIYGGGILRNLGLSPEYSYINDCNVYSFSIKHKQMGMFASLGIAVVVALIVGSLGYLFSGATRDVLLNDVLIPLNDAFLNILGCIAGPMVFLSVAWGIYGIGDAATLKKVGKKLCFSYIGMFILVGIVFGWLALPLFDLSFAGGNGGASSMPELLTMLLGIIPKNIFSPFVDGNTLQIIALAIVIGIAMLFLGQKTDFIAKVVEQINYIVMFLIEAISRLVPYFIFIVLLKILWSDMLNMIAGIGKLVIVFLCAVVLSHVGIVGYTALRNKVSPVLLMKKELPTLTIALMTASSAAAFDTNMSTCREEFGIDDKLCSFGIPLGIVMSKPASVLIFITTALYFAEFYALDISASWLIILLITAAVLSIATPPIPGGGMATYAVLFAQLGIPMEALAIALACETVFDFVMTAFNQVSIQMVLINQAGKLGLVDREKLVKRKK